MKSLSRRNSLTWETILFFALYIIMPEYCALEFSSSIPLLTASRGVLILLGLMLIIRRRNDLFSLGQFKLKNLNFLLTKDPVLRNGLLGYFVLMLITDASFLLDLTGPAIKDLFVLAAEQYILIWLLSLTLDTREKLMQALKVLVYSAGITAVIVSVSVILDNNLFHYLKFTQREMLMTTYYRLGLLRAEAGFGHPVFYGAFCAVILPVNMYLLEEAPSRRERLLFSACAVMNLSGLVLAGSRGSLLAFGVLAGLMLPIKLLMRMGKKMLLNYLAIVLAAGLLLNAITALSPGGSNFLSGIANSVFSIFTSGQSQDAETPTEPDEELLPGDAFGENENGMRSRIIQLTGIQWTLERKPVFGFGPEAQNRGDVAFEFRDGEWWSSRTFDMNLVSVIGQYGLVGLLAHISLYGCVLWTLLRKKMWKDKLMMTFFFVFTGIFLCLLSVSSLSRPMWVFIGLFVCYINLCKKPEASPPAE